MLELSHVGVELSRRTASGARAFFSLPNLLAGRRLLPEILQGEVEPPRLARKVSRWLDDHIAVEELKQAFSAIRLGLRRQASHAALPFGLPGVNKQKKVGNGNYLWISYFRSYLNAKGRAGFVMSSQASSAGHGEKEVRRKIVETGDVDVMISIRSNFFYTAPSPASCGSSTAPRALFPRLQQATGSG